MYLAQGHKYHNRELNPHYDDYELDGLNHSAITPFKFVVFLEIPTKIRLTIFTHTAIESSSTLADIESIHIDALCVIAAGIVTTRISFNLASRTDPTRLTATGEAVTTIYAGAVVLAWGTHTFISI